MRREYSPNQILNTRTCTSNHPQPGEKDHQGRERTLERDQERVRERKREIKRECPGERKRGRLRETGERGGSATVASQWWPVTTLTVGDPTRERKVEGERGEREIENR